MSSAGKTIDHLYIKHVLHSLSIAAVFDFQPGMEVIDIGCGGGFPSVPLAILFPETHFHAVDSINKKLTVVKKWQQVHKYKISRFSIPVRVISRIKSLMWLSAGLLLLLKNYCNGVNIVKKTKPSKEQNDEEQLIPSGLICLKVGDLAQEIHDSHCHPNIWEIRQFFSEDFFAEKYVLQVN
jgi:16S rRNA (guanine527-N7)-methyltransferase